MLATQNNFIKVIFISILLSCLFWSAGFYLAIDKNSFLKDHSFLYQIFWLPVHLLLAYFSILVYKKAAFRESLETLTLNSLFKELNKNYRTILFSILLVVPFVLQDLVEGYSMVQENFPTMGNATWVMIGPVWVIEWLCISVMWSRVLATIHLTVKTYTQEYVDQNLDKLLILEAKSPLLQAGVENALINLMYAFSTIGYIVFAGGETTDYQNVVISGALVLISFLACLLFLRMRINEALERLVAKNSKFLDEIYMNPEHPLTKDHYREMKINSSLIDGFVLTKAAKFSNRAHERICIMRASILIRSIQQNGFADQISVPLGIEAMKYAQFEQKLASLGIVELQGVMLRLGSSLLMMTLKSNLLSRFL
jgi:hypothetical protein